MCGNLGPQSYSGFLECWFESSLFRSFLAREKEKNMSVTKTVYEYLDSLKECDISGWHLFDVVELATGRKPYPSTILNICRKYADITGADFDCVDRQRSKYHFTPGIRLGTAIIAGRE